MAAIQMVYKFVQNDDHIIPIVKNNYKYYLWLIVVAMAIAMATIVVDYTLVQGSMVMGILPCTVLQ